MPEVINRHLATTLQERLRHARAVCLLGARQVGKSTLVQILPGFSGTQLRQLDDQSTFDRASEDPVGFIADATGPIAIDEVQRVPQLLDAIKIRLDRDNTPGQFLLTGSANLINLRSVADALPGRIDYLTLHPFSQGELRGHRETFLDAIFAGEAPRITGAKPGRRSYCELIVRGGYPEAQRRPASQLQPFFTGYIETLLGRDLGTVADVRAPTTVGDVFESIALRSGAIANYAELGRDSSVSLHTARSYVDVLENLFLIARLRSWHRNLGVRLVKAPRWYCNDSALAAAYMGIDAAGLLADDAPIGPLLETFVIGEIKRQNSWQQKSARMYYYRDTNKREIDLVLERPGGDVVGIEVKAAASTSGSDFRHIKFLRDQLGKRFKQGIVLYTGTDTIAFGDRLAAVPLCGLWE